MELLTTGFIIRTEHYSACVDFYQRVLGLPIVEEKHDGDFHMTHFAFGGAYLLIETGGTADPVGNGPIWKRNFALRCGRLPTSYRAVGKHGRTGRLLCV